jgi:two-component system, chemotaxis family, protein-glutamate methylesterase/glutaminase
LELGAVDFVLKFTPGAPVRPASIKREILTKIKMAAVAPSAPRRAPRMPVAAIPRIVGAPRRARPAAITAPVSGGPIVIGASTGGLRAISELIEHLPDDFKQPCIIVQHLPPTFTAPFAAQLERHARIGVKEAAAGDRLEPGVALVTPGDHHLLVRPGGLIDLIPVSDDDPYRPSINRTMTSVAESYGAAASGVILTGMGWDGVEGLRRIREAGGETYAQELASCVVASMPERAIDAGAAVHVARPERIAQLIGRGRR